MNFEQIPFAHHRYGFEIMLGIQLALSGALMLVLRWRKMI
jgi:Mg2+ and Co2+ transporter CorA